jgi:hypothetical protein
MLSLQVRQPRNIDRDPPRLVRREHLRLAGFGITVAGVDEGKGLPVGVADDIPARDGIGMPRAQGSGGPSFRARRVRRPVVVWPPAHRRDLKRRSLPRIDPATRRAPTWPAKRIRPAATVCYPQRDVFIERRALDWIPAIVHLRRPHYQRSSRCRTIAGLFGFLIYSHSVERPDR